MKFSKQRLEAISDGIIAIIMTIMVLSIPLPQTFDWAGIWSLLTTIAIYFVSFVVVGSFWEQHHRMFTFIDDVSKQMVWINFMFLFFLSLIPIFTKWVMENTNEIIPAIGYNIVYISCFFTSMVIFKYIARTSEHHAIQEIRSQREQAELQRQAETPRFGWIRVAMALLVVAAIVALTIFLPHVSTYLLISFPVVSSVANLLFDNQNRNSKRKPGR